jgi:hypothetical protein
MKTNSKLQILFVFLTCFINMNLHGQYARSFHTSDYAEDIRTNNVFNYNNDRFLLSTKECNDTTFKLQIIQLDSYGETVAYHTINSNSFYGYHMISGISVNSDTIVVTLQSKIATLNKLLFLKIDLTSFTIIDNYISPLNFKFGFSECVQKNDSLVIYMSHATTGIYRLSHSLNNLSSFSQELVSSINNLTGSSPGHKAFELIINSQDEYVVSKSFLYHRNSAGLFSSQVIALNLINCGFSFIQNSNNELVLFKSNSYLKFDMNLNQIASGTINGIILDPTIFQEVDFDGVNYNYFISGPTFLNILKLDQNFQLISYDNIHGQTQLFGLTKFGTEIFLYGNKIEKCPSILFYSNQFSLTPNSDFVIRLTDNTIPKFYEYSQELSNDNQTSNLGHLNNLLLVTPNNKGLTQLHNQHEKSVIFSAKNFQTASLNTTAYSYGSFSKDSLLPGPYTPSVYNNFQNIDKYNRGYYVDKELINNHLSQISTGNTSYVIPFGIREWPAHGNTILGQAENLAPFFDMNDNQIYEPELGEYPSIYGDKCILYIYHHPENFANSNSSEILQYNYVFDCDTSEAIKNTLFMTLKNINRSTINLSNYYIGTYIDYDLGLPFDDLIATNVELGMIYSFNGDNFDEEDAGTLGFNDTLVSSGMMILQGPKQNNDDSDNLVGPFANESVNGFGFDDGIIDNENLGLTTSYQFTNVLFDSLNPPMNQMLYAFQGLQYNGTPFLLDTVPVRHIYFGNTDPNYYSSNGVEHSNNFYNPGPSSDSRIVGVSGGNVKFESGDTITYTTAYITAIDSINLGSNAASIQKLFSFGAELKNMFSSNNAGCLSNFGFYESPFSVGLNEMNQLESLSIYPNPTSETLTINGLENSALLTVLSLNGIQLLSSQISNGEEVDLSFLPKSIYILKIETSKGVITKRIVKN